jgi:hypothetical protein
MLQNILTFTNNQNLENLENPSNKPLFYVGLKEIRRNGMQQDESQSNLSMWILCEKCICVRAK